MRILINQIRPALAGGLFAAVLLGLPLPFTAPAAEIAREGSLYPSEPIAFGNFGTDIALFDDTVVVGNWIEERAYVYRRTGGVWSEQHKFVNNGSSVFYGNAVAVHGDWMAIAAQQEVRYTNNAAGVPIGVPGAGAVNLHKRDPSGAWNLETQIGPPNPGNGGQYGTAVSMTSNRLAVTQFYNRDVVNSGIVHLYELTSAGNWVREATKLPFNPTNNSEFGFAVALARNGDRVVVGAPKEYSSSSNVNSTPIYTKPGAGAAYIYRREVTANPVPVTNWVQEAYLKASNPDQQDWFGYAVAMDETGDTVVVGAHKEDGNFSGINGGQGNSGGSLEYDRGAAYVFARSPGTTNWSQVAYLKPFGINTNSAGLDYFGWSTAISGGTILVGAYNGTRDATYVFARSNGVWATRQRLTNSGPSTVGFGYAVAIEGNVAAISAQRDSTGANRAGAAFVYSGFATAPPLPNPTIVFQPGGAAVDLTFYGVPGQQYLLQRSESLSPPNWITLQTITAAPDGKVSYTDLSPPPGGAFYRITPP